MNKEISKSPKKHEFLLNLAKSPPLSVDHFDYYLSKPHSKDSMNDPDDHLSFHRDVLTTATEYLSTKNMPTSTNSAQGRRSHLKKKSFDYLKDSVTHNLVSPSSTNNSKLMGRASQSRAVNKSNTSQHISFLNSKEFAKFALSKVLPKDLRKDKYITQSSPNKGSKPTSVDKNATKSSYKDDMPVPMKPASLVNSKKPSKVKGRVSNLTYNDFSSMLDQSKGTHSFMNSPQRRANIQVSLTSTKSTSNLRTPSSKTTHHSSKNSLFQNPLEAYKSIDPKKNKPEIDQYAELPKHKERNKGMQSIASILNLRRDKKFSPDKNVNSWHPAAQNHRKIASIANTAHESAYSFNTSVNQSNYTQNQTSQFMNTQEDRHHLLQRSPSNGQKTWSSPSRNARKTTGQSKKDDPLVEIQEMTGKESCMEHFTGLRNTFDNLLDRYKGDIEHAQESFQVMRKIKKAYEAFIMELLATQNQVRQQSQVILNEEIEFKRRCETLTKDKQILEDQVNSLKAENHQLFNMVNDHRNRPQKEPDSGITMLNNVIKKGTEELIEDIRMNKNNGPQQQMNNNNNAKMNVDLETLKRIVITQQNLINDFEGKEQKMARLITAIRKTGFDVDRVIHEEFNNGSTSDNSLSHSVTEREPENAIISLNCTEREYEYDYQPKPAENSNRLEILSLTDGGDFSDLMIDSKDYQMFKQSTEFQTTTGASFGRTTPLNTVNTMIKNKLKLDFRGMPIQPQNPNKLHPGLNMKLPIGHILAQQPDNAEPMGFHDEFMAKIEEFSLSWRQAALNQRNF